MLYALSIACANKCARHCGAMRSTPLFIAAGAVGGEMGRLCISVCLCVGCACVRTFMTPNYHLLQLNCAEYIKHCDRLTMVMASNQRPRVVYGDVAAASRVRCLCRHRITLLC